MNRHVFHREFTVWDRSPLMLYLSAIIRVVAEPAP